jgi:hypothetical protein
MLDKRPPALERDPEQRRRVRVMVASRRADNRGGMFRDSEPQPAPRLFHRLLPEAFALMRERWIPYGLLALACALSALAVFASGDPLVVLRTPPINVILIAALIAIFFVLPSALRRIQPSFKMTAWRAVITLATLFCVGVATEIGYAAAVIPGIIVGVLMSQALINALLRTGERSSAREAAQTVWGAFRGSFHLTRDHFVTTLGITILSLTILGIPFTLGLIALLVGDSLDARSLVAAAPALFMTFIYCECLRYVLIVRWYRRLEIAHANRELPAAPATTTLPATRTIRRIA